MRDDFVSTRTDGISVHKLRDILRLLETHSLQELEESKIIPARTLTRYKKILRNFGINKGATYSMKVDDPHNLEQYHHFLLANLDKFSRISNFRID